MKLSKPFEKNFRITQKFGDKFLYLGKDRAHQGLDFGCPKGTPILAAHAGKVLLVRKDSSDDGWGFEVRIAGADFFTQYAHLSEICVEEGREVQIGDQLGLSGNTGFCLGKTGEHLHFGLKRGDEWVDPLPEIAKQLAEPDDKEEAEEVEPAPIGEGEQAEGSDDVTAPVEEDTQKKKVFSDASLVRQTAERCVEIFGDLVGENGSAEDVVVAKAEFEKRVKLHFQID